MQARAGGETSAARARSTAACGRGAAAPMLGEINVTPLVDVVLVLLLVFMVTAPMMSRGIDVSLPVANQPQVQQEDRVTVSVNADGRVFVGDKPVNIALLEDQIRALTAGARRRRLPARRRGPALRPGDRGGRRDQARRGRPDRLRLRAAGGEAARERRGRAAARRARAARSRAADDAPRRRSLGHFGLVGGSPSRCRCCCRASRRSRSWTASWPCSRAAAAGRRRPRRRRPRRRLQPKPAARRSRPLRRAARGLKPPEGRAAAEGAAAAGRRGARRRRAAARSRRHETRRSRRAAAPAGTAPSADAARRGDAGARVRPAGSRRPDGTDSGGDWYLASVSRRSG